MFNDNSPYSLSKARQILKASYKWYSKRGGMLKADELRYLENHLEILDNALLQKNQMLANDEARLLETFCKEHFKKSPLEYFFEVLIAVCIALLVATVIRSSWFELYEIPSGSMRPTFAEQDHLTVSKTTFGINVPLQTSHFFFEPKNVQRTSIFIWSGDGIQHLDSDSTFMKIFPYTKRYIKRCMGKPGDTLYFYGGKIYGMDQSGNEILELTDSPYLTQIDHVPFLNFEGRRSYVFNNQKVVSESIFNHFNQPIGRYLFDTNQIKGEIFNGKEWVKDQPTAQLKPHNNIETYSDFFGIRNYAVSRLLNKKQVEALTSFAVKDFEDAPLYLEIRHTPSVSYPPPAIYGNAHTYIKGYSTLLPLQAKHLDALMSNMYTCRFTVKDGKGQCYSAEGGKRQDHSPLFPSIPNGTYEFYYGKGVEIGFAAIAKALPLDHPLYSHKPQHVQKLYNIGMEMNTYFEPNRRMPDLFPNRYTYFRDGNLYTMGGLVMSQDDPALIAFKTKELEREKASTEKAPYVAFKDYGPPLTEDSQLDKDFMKVFGYKVPDKSYLALGDNHAMSCDSRLFGPVPEDNLQGTPSLILWPPGDRFGFPDQKPYPLFTTSRLIVWSIIALILLAWYVYHRYSIKKPVFKKINFH
jgi:signal peptidase I